MLLAALGVVLAACGTKSAIATSTAGDPTSAGAVVFQGNFSDPGQQWPTSSNATTSASTSGDSYTVHFNSAGRLDALSNIATVQPQDLTDVSVSVSVTPSSVRTGDAFGVLCRDVQRHAYAFVLGPTSSGHVSWSIDLLKPENARQLAHGTTAAPPTSPYVVRGDCVEGGQNHKPVVLALYLGGNLVGSAKDTKLPAPYAGRPGLTVASASGATTVQFSNFQVRRATAS